MNRRKFILASSVLASCSATAATPKASSGHPVSELPAFPHQQEERPQLDPDMVRQFVAVSHGRMETVKELIAKEPMLVNASWDWVNGDWETGLGASSHVGNRDIAHFLLDHGARINAFAMTMLGHTDMVAAIIAGFPKLHTVKGPHGIPMISHAIYGGEPADDVLQLLLEKGADVNATSNGGQTPLMAAASIGRAEIVEHLAENGADLEATDGRDRKAIDYARSREQDEVVELLEELAKK